MLLLLVITNLLQDSNSLLISVTLNLIHKWAIIAKYPKTDTLNTLLTISLACLCRVSRFISRTLQATDLLQGLFTLNRDTLNRDTLNPDILTISSEKQIYKRAIDSLTNQ